MTRRTKRRRVFATAEATRLGVAVASVVVAAKERGRYDFRTNTILADEIDVAQIRRRAVLLDAIFGLKSFAGGGGG